MNPSDMLIFLRSLNTFFGIWRIRGPLAADGFASPPNPQGPEPPERREKPSHRDPRHPSPALLPQFFPARYRHFPVTPSLDLGVPASQRSAREDGDGSLQKTHGQKEVLPKVPKNHKKSDGTGHINSSEKLNTTRENRAEMYPWEIQVLPRSDRFFWRSVLYNNPVTPQQLVTQKSHQKKNVAEALCEPSHLQFMQRLIWCLRKPAISQGQWLQTSLRTQFMQHLGHSCQHFTSMDQISSENPHNSGGFSPPLWKMMEWKSVGMMKFSIWWESHKIPWFQTTNQNLLVSFALQICLPAQENTSEFGTAKILQELFMLGCEFPIFWCYVASILIVLQKQCRNYFEGSIAEYQFELNHRHILWISYPGDLRRTVWYITI